MNELQRVARAADMEAVDTCTICGGELAGEPWQPDLEGSAAHLRCLPGRLRAEHELGPGDKAEDGDW